MRNVVGMRNPELSSTVGGSRCYDCCSGAILMKMSGYFTAPSSMIWFSPVLFKQFCQKGFKIGGTA